MTLYRAAIAGRVSRRTAEQGVVLLLWGDDTARSAHTYELHVCALDGLLDLQTGFYLNELYHKMEGHIFR